MNLPSRDGFNALLSADWWRGFLPARTRINNRERLRIVAGSLFGIFLTGLLCFYFGQSSVVQKLPWLVAPLGASAVLVFAVPAGPMSQPWPVVGGNTLSALVGIAGVHGMHLLGSPELAAALAVATAIAVMLAMRCLHPPGGAMALMMVMGGIREPAFALYPVLLNCLLLVLAGIGYNNATRRHYPHSQLKPAAAPTSPTDQMLDADLDAVLARYNQVLDVSRDDLKALLVETQLRAYERKLTQMRCADIMSRDLVTVAFDTPLQQAWALLRERRIKALPVVDKSFRIAGIITLADFMRAAELDVYEGFGDKLRNLVRTTASVFSSKPKLVGQIMTRNVRVASMERYLVELLPLFGSTGHHHIPIVDEDKRLVGMITQSDLVAVLGRAADPSA
ncbi:MAG: HPP family protein [Polaromonas sp.]